MTGILSLVGTPIGNLGDMTIRAIQCLKDAEQIYAEDTRRTRALLSHLGIEGKRLLALHAHSSERAIESVVESLKQGIHAALVTDAGMPSVSDPGSELVRAARKASIEVTVLPGPSAVTAAVALSGLVDGPFCFLGFLPRKGAKRQESLRAIEESSLPIVLFESPHRIHDTLVDLLEACGEERLIALCREVTKKYEETLVLPLKQVADPQFREKWQGEFTLVVQRALQPKKQTVDNFDLDERARQLLNEGNSVKIVAQLLVKELVKRGEKASRRELYARVLSLSEDPAPAQNN